MAANSRGQAPPGRQHRRTGLFVSVFAGVITSLLLSFVPFSTAVGGVVAGYLRGGSGSDGAFAGGVAGVVVFAPFFLLIYLLLGLFALGGVSPLFSSIVVAIFVGVGLYTIGAAVAGGVIGAYLSTELGRRVPVLDDI